MCHPPSGYIIFGLRKLKFWGDRITQIPLVIRVTAISFVLANFVTDEKAMIMMLHIKRSFLLLKF